MTNMYHNLLDKTDIVKNVSNGPKLVYNDPYDITEYGLFGGVTVNQCPLHEIEMDFKCTPEYYKQISGLKYKRKMQTHMSMYIYMDPEKILQSRRIQIVMKLQKIVLNT